jgi:hypothetical protein
VTREGVLGLVVVVVGVEGLEVEGGGVAHGDLLLTDRSDARY